MTSLPLAPPCHGCLPVWAPLCGRPAAESHPRVSHWGILHQAASTGQEKGREPEGLSCPRIPGLCRMSPRSATTAGVARIEPAGAPRRQVLAVVGLVIVGKHRQRARTGHIVDGRLTGHALARAGPAGTDGGRQVRPLLGRSPGRGVGQIQMLRPRTEVPGVASAAMMLRAFPESRLRRHACIRRHVRRLHRRRIRLLRLRGQRLHDLLRGLGLRSLPLLRRLSHLRRSTLRGPRLRPAGNGRRRRNLRPGLADSRAPRCSRAHAARGLHARCGRRRRSRWGHALPHRCLAGRSLGDRRRRRRRLPRRSFSLGLGTLCFREGRTCRLASRGQVGHGLGRRHLGAARGTRCSA